MARTTNEFGGGEIVPSIEAITGVQAPVRADFVAVPFGTVNHEHGERRQIQNQLNNLKGSSGIERISFDGLDELDTEQGPAGERVYALNTGDSRIRFIDGTRQWRVFASGNSGGTQPGTVVEVNNTASGTLDVVMGQVEITFFGTGLNILSWVDTAPSNWVAFVDGSSTGTQISPNNNTINLTPPAQFDVTANRAIKVNQVVPVASGLTAGVHTVRIEGREHGVSGGGGCTFPLFGCEVINENVAITQQAGADFDGRVEALSGTTFPIKPTNTTITSLNSRTGTTEAFTGTTGARVLNYITSGGQFKQSFDIADEAPGAAGASTTAYTIEIDSGSASVTIPAGISSFQAFTYGGGGGGGGGVGYNFMGAIGRFSGGGGGGGGLATSTFSRDSGNTAALSLAVTAGAQAAGSPQLGTATGGNDSFIQVSSADVLRGDGGGAGGTAQVAAFTNGGGGGGGSVNTTANIASWTASSASTTNGAGGSTGITADTGGSGGSVGGVGNSPLTGTEGEGRSGAFVTGNGAAGNVPGGGGSGGGSSPSSINVPGASTGGAGAAGRVYIIATSTDSTLTNTSFNVTAAQLTDTTTTTGVDAGAPTAVFGNIAFDSNRLNQEVIRRINFREFGANSAFATLGTSDANNAFTLDDGTTTLVARDAASVTANGLTGLSADTNGAITITFVGTGLDVVNNRTGPLGAHTVSVDGLSIGTLPTTQPIGVIPIVSGLSYGTHTVSFLPTGAPRISIVDFIIYGPKKPEIPTLDAGSLELSDYNIMADYSADTANNINSMSKGILGKAVARECILNNGASGTARWSTELSVDGNNYGSRLNETGDGSTREELFYTFYGDAFSMRMKSNTVNSASNHEFFLDGVQITRTNAEGWDVDEVIFLNNTNNGTSDPSQTWPATGDVTRFDGSDTTKIIFPPSFNMGLGVHTIRIRHAGNSPGIFYGMEIGTPIHINDDTLKVGSEGLNNLTIDPVVEEDEAVVLANRGEAKAWINYDPVNNRVLSSFNISAAIETTTNNSQLQVFFDKPFKDATYVALSQVLATSPGGTGNIVTNGFKQANFCRMQTESSADTFGIFAAFYGELIDE